MLYENNRPERDTPGGASLDVAMQMKGSSGILKQFPKILPINTLPSITRTITYTNLQSGCFYGRDCSPFDYSSKSPPFFGGLRR